MYVKVKNGLNFLTSPPNYELIEGEIFEVGHTEKIPINREDNDKRTYWKKRYYIKEDNNLTDTIYLYDNEVIEISDLEYEMRYNKDDK